MSPTVKKLPFIHATLSEGHGHLRQLAGGRGFKYLGLLPAVYRSHFVMCRSKARKSEDQGHLCLLKIQSKNTPQLPMFLLATRVNLIWLWCSVALV